MKKKIQKDVHFCDHCQKEYEYPSTCLKCKVEYCYECSKKYGITYNHGVYFSGSGDGFYCQECDIKLKATKDSLLHAAYLAVRSLRDEAEDWSKRFRQRQEAAEARIKKLSR